MIFSVLLGICPALILLRANVRYASRRLRDQTMAVA